MAKEDSRRPFIVCGNCGNSYDSDFGIGTVQGCHQSCPFCGYLNRVPDRSEGDPVPDMPPWLALRFLRAKTYPSGYRDIVATIKTASLSKVVESFVSSVSRLHSLMDLPAALIYFSRTIEHKANKAMLEVFGSLEPSEITPEKELAWNGRMTELVREWAKNTNREAHLRDFVRVGQGNLPSMLKNGGEELMRGFQAILVSQLIGVWTAFETLAGDIWEVALNTHPHGLAELKGTSKRIANRAGTKSKSDTEELTGPQRRGEAKSVSLQEMNRLTRGTYDVSRRMGTLLRRGFNFTRLEGIRAAYSTTFHEHSDKIDQALADRAIDALNAVRNLFVHRAGIVDYEYIEKAKVLSAIPRLPLGEQFPINGELVGTLIGPVLQRSMDLTLSVDRWLAAHANE